MGENEACEYLHVHEDAVARVKARMPDDDETIGLADFFKMFSDSTRVRILCLLSYEELCVCDISAMLGVSQSAISHQLRLLKQAKLVKNHRDGKTVFYSLSDEHVKTIIGNGMEHIEE